jgi:hypothetical protein
MKTIYLFITILFTSIAFSQNTLFEKKIYFETNKSDISVPNQMYLDSLVESSQNESNKYSIIIEGFTDEKGTIENNILLSESRAKSVNDYLVKKGFKSNNIKGNTIVYSGNGIYNLSTTDSLQRNATLSVSYTKWLECLVIDNDTVDAKNYIRNFKEYYTTESMIKNKMFAIDTLGNILKTGGMISYDVNKSYFDNSKGSTNYYTRIKVPVKKGETFDKDMKIWVSQINGKGEIQWIDTKYTIEYDKESNSYVLILPCYVNNKNIKINIDKYPPIEEEIIYFSTFKNLDFYDVEIRKASFSAIVNNENESLYAFVKDAKLTSGQLVFYGKFREDGKEKTLMVNLQKCIIKKFKNQKHYFLSKKSNYFIGKKEYNKQTGFWAWVKRIFS